MSRTRSLNLPCWILLLFSALRWTAPAGAAEAVTFRLKTGDRISGTIVGLNTNAFVLSNSWVSALTIPRSRVASITTNVPAGVNGTEVMVFQEVGPPTPTANPAKPKNWKGEAQVGLDLLFGAKDRQIVYGRFKLNYQKQYASDPKKFFRNAFDYSVEYGVTETRYEDENGVFRRSRERTSDRMYVSDKMAFDLMGPWYVYNVAGGGYDHILRINAQYEAGPGAGYHLITRTNFTLNTEAGLVYQAQYRSDETEVEDVYYRLAQDITWKLWSKVSIVEKLEYFPRVNLTGHRMRFETTLRYDLWKNLALNLTVLDLYDTDPAEGIGRNELQVRSSLGLKF